MHPSFNLTFTSVMMSKLCVYSCSDTRVVQESCQCCVPVMRMDAAHAALCVCIAICAQVNPLKHILALTWIRCVGSPICMNQYVRDILGAARRFPLAPSLSGLGVGRAQYMYGTWDDITPPYLRAALFLKLKRAILSSLSLSLMLIFFWHTAEGKNNKNNKVYASFFCGICNSFSTFKYTDVKKSHAIWVLELLC